MADEDGNDDIEDMAEDAVNELLGMYGYEGVGKDELKSSLKKRGLTFAGGNDFSLSKGNYHHHPYLHPIPVNRLLMATTSTAATSKSTAASKEAQMPKSKATKSKVQPTVSASCSTTTASNGAKNLQLCQWCKKEKAQIVETLQPPTMPNLVSATTPAVGSKLRFCSSSCLNAYKLDIFRRETEACLRNNNNTTINSSKGDDSESEMNVEKAVPVNNKAVVVESKSAKVNSPKTSRFRKESASGASSDLWTSAVGNGKKLAGRSSASWKSEERFEKSEFRKSDSGESIEEQKSTASNASNNAKQQQRSKRRSAPPRPHPYYALNKKYWMTVRGGGGGGNDRRTPDESREREESSTGDGDTIDDINYQTKSASSILSLSDVLPVQVQIHEPKRVDECNGSASESDPSPKIDESKTPPSASSVDFKTQKEETPIPSSAAVPFSANSLSSLFSALPLNLVWIPVPIPIPLPVPIPIPVSSFWNRREKVNRETESDSFSQD